MLYAIETPEQGGDTLFADLAAAYEALLETTKRRIRGLQARHQYRWDRNQDHPEGRWHLLSGDEQKHTPEVVHPVVRLHPETNESSVFVFPGITSGVKGIVGEDEADSDALLHELWAHTTSGAFQFRYKWRERDVVIWDNRATMHRATTDTLPPDRFRSMWRINTTGTAPQAG